MEIMVSNCNVLYEDWQMQCCGEEIKVNDNVILCLQNHNPRLMGGWMKVEFYEGLLLMARNYIIDSSDSFYNYNKMKSPIIEKYLKTGCLFSEKPLKRQVEIRYILELNSDCDYIIKSIQHPNKPFIVTENKLPIPDKDGNLICVSGLSQWIREVQDLKFEIKMFEEFEVDFNELQERGLRLAKEIKDQMPDYFDLWYYMPLLDKENKYQHPILIF